MTLTTLGWDDRLTALFAEHADAGLVPGRVSRVDRTACQVLLAADAEPLTATAESLPAVGDWVALDGDRVAAVLPRHSALARQDPIKEMEQVVATNVDTVFVVASMGKAPNVRRIERTLALAWDSGAVPWVVLTKRELAADPDAYIEEVRVVAVGVEILAVSARTGEQMDRLHEPLRPNRTAVMIGASGVGKSTLANWLVGDEVLAVGDIREVDGKGRHTTTARQLLTVPSGGVLIDTPGLRSLGLWQADEGVAAVFADIIELAEGCRFRDCRHGAEPGCVVIGQVDPDRLDSWRALTEPPDPGERKRQARIAQKAVKAQYRTDT